MNDIIQSTKKAYLYSRVSSEKQAGENSTGLDRQLELAINFLKNYPEYTLEDSYVDAGVSSYHGSNLVAEAGLSKFIANCEDGYIEEGSLLIIEAPDRLSRLGIRKGQELFSKLLDYKINIGLVKYNTLIKHDDNNDIANSLIVSIGLYLGHLESEQKSMRIKQAFKITKSKGLHASGNYPLWLSLSDDRKTFNVISAHKKTLEKIFKLRIEGWGSLRIASYLNENIEQFPTITGKVRHTKSIVEKYLRSKAVYGTWERQSTIYVDGKRKKGEVVESIENYFPVVIPYENWVLANNKQRKVQGKVNKDFVNLFRGLLFCTRCGSTVSVVNPNRGRTKFLCKGRVYLKNGCDRKNHYYDDLEESVLKWLSSFDFSALQTNTGLTDKVDFRRKEAELIEEKKKYENYLEAIAKASNHEVISALTKKLEDSQTLIDIQKSEIDKAYLDSNVSFGNINKIPLLNTVEQRQSFHNYISKFIKYIGVNFRTTQKLKNGEGGEFKRTIWVQTQSKTILQWDIGEEQNVISLTDLLDNGSGTEDLKQWFTDMYSERLKGNYMNKDNFVKYLKLYKESKY